MSVGKLTLLSADCDGSGATVGSSAMVADSSGAEGTGCAGGGGVLPAADVLAAAGALPRAAAGPEAGLAWAFKAPAVVDTEAGSARLAAFAGGGWWVACSAARSVTSATPDKSTPLRAISHIDRLFGITHHSETYCCTGAIRAVTPGQSQIRCRGGLPIGTAYDMTRALFRAQWISDRRRVHK
jgi:hypothetical protein